MDPLTAALIGKGIELALSILIHGPEALRQMIEINRQSGALTDEQAAGYLAQIDQATRSPAWQTDAELGGGVTATITGGTGRDPDAQPSEPG